MKGGEIKVFDRLPWVQSSVRCSGEIRPLCMLPVEGGLLAVNKSPDSYRQPAAKKGLVKSDKSMLY